MRLGRALARRGVSANHVTSTGVLVAALCALAIASGHLLTGVVLLTVGGLMDFLDGAVAKAAGSSSIRGAFFDSVADRVSDGLVFAGVAAHFLVGPHPRLALIPIAILGVSAIVSYERAKAESLGLKAHGGMMERAERLVLLGVALALHFVLVPLLIVLLVLTSFTAIGRFRRVWLAAGGEQVRSTQRHAARAREWEAWRERARQRARRSGRGREQLEPMGLRVRRAFASGRDLAPRDRRHAERSGSERRRSARALRQRVDGSHS